MDIKNAHQRLRELVGQGRGGSHFLTVKTDQAKAVLLGCMDEASKAASSRPDRLRTHR